MSARETRPKTLAGRQAPFAPSAEDATNDLRLLEASLASFAESFNGTHEPRAGGITAPENALAEQRLVEGLLASLRE